MTENHGLLHSPAFFKQQYMWETSEIHIVLNFGIITAYTTLSEDFIWIHFNLTMPEVIALSIPGYVLVCHLIGHYNEKIGFLQVEKNLIYRFSPCSDEMRKDIREIKESLVKGT